MRAVRTAARTAARTVGATARAAARAVAAPLRLGGARTDEGKRQHAGRKSREGRPTKLSHVELPLLLQIAQILDPMPTQGDPQTASH